MKTHSRRTHSRSTHEEPIVFTEPRNGKYFKGIMCNCGCEGMYLESAQPIEPGVEILIRKKNRQRRHAASRDNVETYLAEVKWCEPLLTEVPPRYGIGLCRKISTHVIQEDVLPGTISNACDLCKESVTEGRMHEIHDGIWLCTKCFIYLESLDKTTRKGIEDLLMGNIV